jgi:hypothetical protein
MGTCQKNTASLNGGSTIPEAETEVEHLVTLNSSKDATVLPRPGRARRLFLKHATSELENVGVS